MFTLKPDRKGLDKEDSFHTSRYNFMGEQDNKYSVRNEVIDNINSKLAINFNQLVQLLTERKTLLLKKITKMYEENQTKIASISKGRLADLRNQARLLKDQQISHLIDNSEKLNSTKVLLKKIIQEHNFNKFQNMEKYKGKKYYDKLKDTDNEINTRSKRFNVLAQELDKICEKERNVFFEIERLQVEMVNILRRKQNDHIRKAERINQQIQRKKILLKENKSIKDKKKKQTQVVLSNIIDTLNQHEKITNERSQQLEQLFGGTQSLQDFDKFLKQFETIVENKFEQRKDTVKEAAIAELFKIANGYQIYIEQLSKERNAETHYLENVNQGLKSSVKIALIEKAYLQEITNDKSKLLELLKKSKSYRILLQNFEGDRIKLNKELSKASHMKNFFFPKLKALSSEDNRKEDLKRELGQLIIAHTELQRLQKKYKQYELISNSYQLAKDSIEREMDDYAQKGNLSEYKYKMKQFENIEKEITNHKQSLSNTQYGKLNSLINRQAQDLHIKYADLINALLHEEQQITIGNFISKLNKRLSLI